MAITTTYLPLIIPYTGVDTPIDGDTGSGFDDLDSDRFFVVLSSQDSATSTETENFPKSDSDTGTGADSGTKTLLVSDTGVGTDVGRFVITSVQTVTVTEVGFVTGITLVGVETGAGADNSYALRLGTMRGSGYVQRKWRSEIDTRWLGTESNRWSARTVDNRGD